MVSRTSGPDLEHDHHPHAIRKRLADGGGHGHLADAVLGAMDGSITTFTIVAGAVGGGLDGMVIVILGLAKVAADALSMAASNYLGARSREQEIEQARAMERRHIEHVPDGEREEIRQIFERKGFTGRILEEIVSVLSRHPEAWVETMLKEELDLPSKASHPFRAAVATFFAFLGVGIIPLAPFLLMPDGAEGVSGAFVISIVITGIAFLAIGLVRGAVLGQSPWHSGVETLLTGSVAAAVAYGIGHWLRHTYAMA